MEAKLTSNQGSTQNLTYFEPVAWEAFGIKLQEQRIDSSTSLIIVCS